MCELVAERQNRREQLAVKVGERFLLVHAEDVVYASFADEAIVVVASQLTGTSNYRTLDELQAQLDPNVFWRVHRSHLVNINKIKEIVPWFSRNYILRMKDAKGDRDPGQPVADASGSGNTCGSEPHIRSEADALRCHRSGTGSVRPRPTRFSSFTRRRGRTSTSRSSVSDGRERDARLCHRRDLSVVTAAGAAVAVGAAAVSGAPADMLGGVMHATPSDAALIAPAGAVAASQAEPAARSATALAPGSVLNRLGEELLAWFKTLASAAVYATLIVTFGFQVARVEGQSMAPTLADQDRLIVNKLIYRIGEPRRGDIVMLYYPVNPDKSFVKRVIAEEGDQVRIIDGRVYVNDVPLATTTCRRSTAATTISVRSS